jgi:hypothetical protein
MWTLSGRPIIPFVSPLVPVLLLAVPGSADIAPESGILVHVQPVSEWGCWSATSDSVDAKVLLLSDCNQIVRSTTLDGDVEFQLYFMTGALGSSAEELCLESIHTVLTWPPAWQLVSYDACTSCSLDPSGTTHALDLHWWGDLYPIGDTRDAVVPLARLVMNVVGPGRLDFTSWAGQAVLRHDCNGPTFLTYPVQVYAEAGMECGHISAHCGYWEYLCEPYFDFSELVLGARTEGAADSTFVIRVAWPQWGWCPVTVETHAPWCSASVEDVDGWQRLLHVTADAAGLTPGTYQTAIEVSGGSDVSRCLPTTFIVEAPTATSPTSWGRVKSLYR